ncbi:MAG TPA: protoglobin domain-containing protein [Myxococcota bacterium]|nr:protoglobin domain-containing protein [Myxococcota bacterium]
MEIDSDTQQRLSFLNLTEDDFRLLSELGPLLEKHADSLVASFYRHLLSFAPTRHLLRDPAVKARLLGKQREYLLSLAHPSFDRTFVDERRKIGEVHQRIGLDPRWYLGAYALYQSLLTPVIWDLVAKGDPEHGSRTSIALQKLLWFDAQLAMEAYIEAGERNLDYLTQELAEQSRKLEREVEDQGTALRQSRAHARAAEELASIATLVAGLAHEIGTPMGVIQGHAKMLESKLPAGDADARWRLETIQGQIARISKIIQTLLNMARPRKARRMPVALDALLQASISFVREKLARRHIEVHTELTPLGSVSGDPERLQQLFLNLFLNAADAMADGGRLEIRLEPGTDGNALVRVADTGGGIRPEDLDKIFDPFFTTKPAGEGNGLGLMVCKGIVGDHGGTIEVASEPDVGTEFRIHLPLAS